MIGETGFIGKGQTRLVRQFQSLRNQQELFPPDLSYSHCPLVGVEQVIQNAVMAGEDGAEVFLHLSLWRNISKMGRT